MLKLVSTVGCSICKKAVGILQNKGIEFDKVDVNSDEGKKIIGQSGMVSLPVIKTDSNQFFSGIDSLKFVKTLK